jgi:protein-disulfide isomerase
MKRYLPVAIILGGLLLALGAGVLLFHFRPGPPPPPAPPPQSDHGKPGAVPAHVRGAATAPVMLEQFGDFECMPCFILWPALKNLEKDYAKSLAITFREHPLPQHHRAVEAARAAEAAGLQGKFWEMHDVLYLQRSKWVHEENVRAIFDSFASELGLDLERFKRDMDGEEVAKRIAADEERGASFGIDRTPVIFINGKRVELQGQVEEGLHKDIDAALGVKPR